MTPKEKAEELVEKFADYSINLFDEGLNLTPIVAAKKCALIAVDEILNSTPLHPNDVDWDDCGAVHNYYYYAQKVEAKNYWQEVKQEIEKI